MDVRVAGRCSSLCALSIVLATGLAHGHELVAAVHIASTDNRREGRERLAEKRTPPTVCK